MKPNNELFSLIKALTPTEKAYFKKFSTRHYKEDNFSLKMFKILENFPDEKDYSEKELKKIFNNGNSASLPFKKIYLYNNILRSLNLYYTEKDADIKISLMINNASLLARKELYSQSLKIIKKAKVTARKNEKYAKLLEAIHVERQALRINSSLNEVSGELMENYAEEAEVLAILSNINEYRKLYDTMVITATGKGISPQIENSLKFKKILNDPLLKSYERAKYLQSKVLFNLMHCFLNNLLNKYEDSINYGIKCIDLLKDSPDSKKASRYEYILILQELMLAECSMGRLDESDKYYKMLFREQDALLDDAPRKIKDFLKVRTKSVKLNINSAAGKFYENVDVINDIIKITEAIEGPAYRDEIIVTDFLAAAIFFTVSDFERSLYHLNRIFNSKAFILREDIQISCRILNLIVHFEMGSIGSLEYYIKSVYRYLRKQRKLNELESLLFGFLKKSYTVKSEKEFISLLKETRSAFTAALEKEPGMMQMIDLDAWLESKLAKKPYIEILSNKRN